MRILMVCIGNICRSPMAEGILKHKVKQNDLDWTVASAGTQAKAGQTPHKYSQKTCLTKGINIAAKGARRFRAEDLTAYDKIYAMSDDVIDEIKEIGGPDADYSHVDLLLNELEPGSNDSVPDPLNGPEAWFTIVYDMVDKAADAIVNKYKQQ